MAPGCSHKINKPSWLAVTLDWQTGLPCNAQDSTMKPPPKLLCWCFQHVQFENLFSSKSSRKKVNQVVCSEFFVSSTNPKNIFTCWGKPRKMQQKNNGITIVIRRPCLIWRIQDLVGVTITLIVHCSACQLKLLTQWVTTQLSDMFDPSLSIDPSGQAPS